MYTLQYTYVEGNIALYPLIHFKAFIIEPQLLCTRTIVKNLK